MSRGGRKRRQTLKITISERAHEALTTKARSRGMTVEALIGELLDLAEMEAN